MSEQIQRKKPKSPAQPGWKDKFFEVLAETMSPAKAAEAAGCCATHPYDCRLADPEFARRWDKAINEAMDRLEGEAYRRAFEGVIRSKYHAGVVVGYETEFSDTLLMFLLNGNRAEKYKQNVNVNLSVADALSKKAEELGIKADSDPILAEIFAAAGAVGARRPANGANGGGEKDKSVSNLPNKIPK